MEPERSSRGMFLQRLALKNFRSTYDVSVEFQPGITLIVGENNSGKSNVIQAVRLVTAPLSRRATRWFAESDLSHGREGQEAEVRTEFAGLTDFQRAHYVTALDVDADRAIYTGRFRSDATSRYRVRSRFTAGPAEGVEAEPEKREQITHVYLAPLRDAQKELDSAEGSRLARIIQHLTTKDEQKEFLEDANKAFEGIKRHSVLAVTTDAIQGHLVKLTRAVREQDVEVTFTEQELNRLTRSMRVKMAEHGVKPADLIESGLGYANLLYIATVILELQKARDAELTLFLVEEPEAHLHPQLQAVLLEYLQEQVELSPVDDSHGPAGRIQVIATTHSPNLASSVGIRNVVALRTVVEDETIASEDGNSVEVSLQKTKSIALASLELTQHERRKIDQYLDATRVGLLFARKVILVEGIAEAVLMPVIARHSVFKDSEEQRRAFRGVTIVNVGSVDFKPYITLLLSEVDGCRLLDQLVVITDADPLLPKEERRKKAGKADGGAETLDEAGPAGPEAAGEATAADDPNEADDRQVYNRKIDLIEHADGIGAAERLIVAEATHTLEADLLGPAENRATLKRAYLKQHPKSGKKWDRFVAHERGPVFGFYRELQNDEKLISKGEFAQDIAVAIADGEPFTSPDYLTDAIKASVDHRNRA
ncbi:AAA family ATPase [Glycomyces luteolus]|uniref:AAA family ATPase n=1 Tax=Glycomyces luteolus TaxID=2670330 RepID=A0A9X3PQ19_9ACTN|nr:AAA family ATPase [Glycomyces luteolus]MDA1363065.1 AAA family ATPase [Glycomyces luteolus]